ncbi:MAG: hypothetical protein QOI01_3668 [Mycobacterium sp.]|nr:hypothetical protein [Mycobacterium sp.]
MHVGFGAGEFTLGSGDLVEHHPRLPQNYQTVLGESHACPVPLEEGRARFPFQCGDLPGDRRLAVAELRRRCAEAASFGGRTQDAKIGQ